MHENYEGISFERQYLILIVKCGMFRSDHFTFSEKKLRELTSCFIKERSSLFASVFASFFVEP